MTSQVNLIKNRVNPFYITDEDVIEGEVETYADLPATANLNDVYVVRTTTGIIGNRKLAGLYVYSGSGWVAIPVAMISSNVFYDNTTSGLSANTVKNAIDELESGSKHVTSASFNTGDGVLTLTLNDSSTITVDLDGRFLQNIIEDTTPRLGGNLDLNSQDITGTGNIDITGEVEATTLIGNMRGATIFKAKAGEALTKGDPVYISGDDLVGNQPVVAIADSDDANKMPCFGLAAETVSLNSNLNVVTFGTLSGLDTSSFNQGDILYVSTTGTLTATKPSGESSLIQNIGKVMRSHASAGSIKVGGAGRTNDVPNLNDGNVFIGNASNQAETRGLTLDDIAETATNKHFTSSDETKLNGIENNATADQTKADIDALGINADQVDGLEASQFLRSDTGDIINVGRGNVYIENNSDDNQNGAGITLRTSVNPTSGDEGSVGSIFAVRSSVNGSRLWVGQSKTTTGLNNFQTNSATFNGNITIISGNNYYMSNNANIFHGINTSDKTPDTTATEYYAVFDSNPVINTDIYSYTTPTSSTNTGIKLLKAGKYKVSYTLNWDNASYTSRINYFTKIVKHSSAITPTETELAGTRSFGYSRDDSYAKYATTTCVTVIDVAANEYIKCQTTVAKNDATFDNNFSGIDYHQGSSIVIEYLGDI